MTDEEIRAEWQRIVRMHHRRGSLGKRLALLFADDLQAKGVSEDDIDRLFPPLITPLDQPKRGNRS